MECMRICVNTLQAASGVVSATFPGEMNVSTTLGGNTSVVQGLFIEMFLTALLVFTIFMLAAEKHKGTFLAPVGIGLSLFVAELAGVYFTGGEIIRSCHPRHVKMLTALQAHLTQLALSARVSFFTSLSVITGSTGLALPSARSLLSASTALSRSWNMRLPTQARTSTRKKRRCSSSMRKMQPQVRTRRGRQLLLEILISLLTGQVYVLLVHKVAN